jgi:outer membrane protein assembly factor BamA
MQRIILVFSILLPSIMLGQENSNDFRSLVVVDTITLEGNNKTKDEVIFREIEFNIGDTVPRKNIEVLLNKSISNLRNLTIFNFVDVNTVWNQNNLSLHIKVTEQWYSWVFPYFEYADRNFNEWWKTKDFSRTDYGLKFIQENFRGRNETLTLKFIYGYNEYLNLEYKIPYFDKKRRTGFFLTSEILRSHEINVLTTNDEINYFNNEDSYPINKVEIESGIIYRPAFTNKHKLSVMYHHYQFTDTVIRINPDFLTNHNPGSNFLSLKYKFISDYRDYISYPLKGHYFETSLVKHGLGLLKKPVDFLTVNTTFKKYMHLQKQWYAAFSATMLVSDEKGQPYFISNGLVRSNLKYELLPARTFNLKFIPLEQFSKVFIAAYLNLFFDAAYIDGFDTWQSNHNKLPDSFLIGKGIGLDIVTYYDKVMRLEYSWNKENKGGLFIHFLAPI